MSLKFILPFAQKQAVLNAQTYTQTGNTTPLISADSCWEVSRRRSVQNDLEVPVLSPKLAVHLSSPVCLMLWTVKIYHPKG